MTRTYLAGPMRGYPLWNFPAFDEAAQAIRTTYGYEVVSPAEIDRERGFDETDTSDLSREWLAAAIVDDVQALSGCDAVILLPGWEKSTGTAVELATARFLGIEVMYWIDGALWKGAAGPDVVRVPVDPMHRILQAALPIQEPIVMESRAHATPSTETRIVDPVTGGAKGQKLARMDLIPWDAVVALSEHYGRGAEKYQDRNWERGYAWSLSFAAAQRHAAAWFQGEDIDAEGFSHLAAWAWHSLNLLAMSLRGIGTDDRPRLALAT